MRDRRGTKSGKRWGVYMRGTGNDRAWSRKTKNLQKGSVCDQREGALVNRENLTR